MHPDLLFDPLFLLPFVIGAVVAVLLALLGCLLLLREEWLAALGYAHLAGAGALIALAVGQVAVLGGVLLAVAGSLTKTLTRASGNPVYAVMILLGWSLGLLVAANTGLGENLARALVDGQLYFVSRADLIAALGLGLAAGISLPWLMPRLLRARFFPRHEQANQRPSWHWRVGFDLLVAAAMAVGTATLGIMGTFVLVLIPAWLAFHLGTNWRTTLIIATLVALFGYVLAFILALLLDQPFAPVLVALMLVLAPFSLLGRAKAALAHHRGHHK
mgnify:CR=1 FL=1